MKKNLRNSPLTIILFVLLAVFVIACKGDDHAHADDEYTCPMHPTVISDKPGACPVCGMSLVKKNGVAEDIEVTNDVKSVLKSPNELVVASAPTTKGVFKTVRVPVYTEGVVAYDPQNINTVATKISGRLEKMFIKFAFQQIKAGQIVAEIYSPELVTAQKELLFLLQQDGSDAMLINGAKSKLEFLGMSQRQIADLVTTKQVRRTFPIHSAYSGYVINEVNDPSGNVGMSQSRPTSGMNDDMSAQSNTQEITPASASAELIREGNYVAKGQRLFSMIQDRSLKIELSIPVQVAKFVKKGSAVTLTFGTGDSLATRIDFVEPLYQAEQKFLTARVYASPSAKLRPGQLVQAMLPDITIEGMWVPKMAVVRMGMKELIFVKDKDGFIPKDINAGIQAGNEINILQGLSSADEVAVNGQYMIDSESFIRINN